MTIDTVRLMRETRVARVEYRPTVDSTNDRAAWYAQQGTETLPLLVVADQQTGGRGRGGNRWWTGPGSLAFSLLVEARTVAADEIRSPLVALAAAAAVVDAVSPLAPDHHVGIRWPNDVCVGVMQRPGGADIPVCQTSPAHRGRQECLPRQADEDHLPDGRKLAGILVEVLPDRRHVIGVGLNVNNAAARAPADLRTKVVAISDLSSRQHDRTHVLIELLRCLERQFLQLCEDREKVAARADSLCLQHGRTLTLGWDNRKITGVCRGIAPDGAIVLETANGLQTFVSGSVVRER